MIALIDADIVVHRAAAVCEGVYYVVNTSEFKYHKEAKQYCIDNGIDLSNIEKYSDPEPFHNCAHTIDVTIRSILKATNATSHKIFISGPDNFRKEVCKEYKANRKDLVPPVHLQKAKEYVLDHWNGILTDGVEADDAMAVEATKDPENSAIASLDKDLDTISCHHYNWVKDELYWVTPEEAEKFKWIQALTGDNADNIAALKGVGPVKAAKILEGVDPSRYACVVGLHYAIEFDDPEEVFERNLKLLTILTELPNGNR